MPEFTLRPMEPTDGPAIDALIREEAQTTSIAMTTSYRHDVYRSLMAQHPSLVGVVAELPGVDGLAGFATAFLDEVTVAGQPYPTAHLENLKVRSDLRRQGLGARLAAVADRGSGAAVRWGRCVLTAAIKSSNAASHRDRAALGQPTRRPGPPAYRAAVRDASARTRAGRSAAARRRH